MSKLRRPLIINFLSSSGATIVQFAVSVILARLLSPREIGVFSITVVFVNLAHMFRDFAVSDYLQQEPELTEDKIRAAIGVLFTCSWSIALLLYCVSGYVGNYFNEPDIAPVMRVLALGFVFIPFGSVTHALLTRELAAQKQAYVTVIGTTSYAASCLILASLGFGTMSLAWANLVNILACALAYAPLRPKGTPWLPSFRNWRRVVHFGGGSLISNCTIAINNALPDMLLGKLGNAQQVGLFSRANSTVSIFTYVAGSTVNYGSLSYISQANHRGEPLSPLLNRAVALLTGIGWPALVLTALFGREIVLALYGPKWLECVPAIPALALAAGVTMLFNFTPIALTALGRPYLSAIPIGTMAVARILLAISFFSGSIASFSLIICAATLLAIPPLLYQQSRFLKYSPLSMLQAVLPSALVTLMCAVAGFVLRMLIPQTLAPILTLLALAAPLAATWYIALRVTKHSLVDEVHLLANKLLKRLGFN